MTAEAMSRALAASQRQMDMFRVIIIASVTVNIGESVRDMFYNRIPLVFQNEIYASIFFASAWLHIGPQHLSAPHNLAVKNHLSFPAKLTPDRLAF